MGFVLQRMASDANKADPHQFALFMDSVMSNQLE
jgi:hypothetical protein